MMDAKLKCADMSEKMDDGSDDKLQLCDSETTDLPAAFEAGCIPAGDLTEVTSFSEQISTEDTELSSADISVKANNTAEVPVESNLHDETEAEASRAVTICSPGCVKTDQPKPLCALPPPCTEACTVYDVSQSFTSMRKSQESLKTTSVHAEPGRADLCAAILLACLFCNPLDCLLATMKGCNACVGSLCSSLCSSLCGCEPTTLQPLLDVAHHCDLCGCLGVHYYLCNCLACDTCLHATECLDFAMEISEILYH